MARRLDKILVVDVESTCWKDKPPEGQVNEIIEIGLVEYEVLSGNVLRKFSCNSKPLFSEVSEFCTNLTGLKLEDLAESNTFRDSCEFFNNVILHLKEYTWASYGDYDRKQFEKMYELHKVPPLFGGSHINIKNLFALKRGLKKEIGTLRALKAIGLDFEGRHHNALDDASNIARILRYILFPKL